MKSWCGGCWILLGAVSIQCRWLDSVGVSIWLRCVGRLVTLIQTRQPLRSGQRSLGHKV